MNRFRFSNRNLRVVTLSAFILLSTLASAAVNIVPKPTTLTLGAGTLALTGPLSIYRDAASDSTLPWVEKLCKQAKIATTRVQAAAGAKISIVMAADANLGSEGYHLAVTATGIT